MAFDNYERYGVRVKKTAADVDEPYSLNGGKSLPILKDLLSEISILRKDILQLKEEIAALHRNGPRPSPGVCGSELEAGTVAIDTEAAESLEPVPSPELIEPTAPMLESEVLIEVPEPPMESIEPVEESVEPAIEQTAMAGGFFDEMPAENVLILPDSVLTDILSSAELHPADLSAEQACLSETVSDNRQEQAEEPEAASTEATSTEVLDITDTTEESEDGTETSESVEEPDEETSTEVPDELEDLPEVDDETLGQTDAAPAEAASTEVLDITDTAEEPEDGTETDESVAEPVEEVFTEETSAEVLDMNSEESQNTLEETSEDEPVSEGEFFQEITLPKDTFLEPELPPLDEVQPETELPPEDVQDESTEVAPEVITTEVITTDDITAEALGELPLLDEETPEVITALPPLDDEPVAATNEPLKQEIAPTLAADIKSVLTYIDDLLINLPEEKIVEFAQSDKYWTYKKVFHELGLG